MDQPAHHPHKGFLGSLFDFTFHEFIFTRVVKFLFGLSIAAALVASISLIVAGFATNPKAAIAAVVFSPVFFVLYVLLARVTLEVLVVIFRIAEVLEEISENTEKK